MTDRRSYSTRTFDSRRITQSLGFLLAIFVALTAAAPSAHAATRVKDPVVKAINAAKVRKHVTAAEAVQLRRTWANSARAARNVKSVTRRASITGVRAYTTNLARRGRLTPDRLAPALLSVEATTWIMSKASRYPSHEQELQIPGEPVVFTYYAGRGVQFQPFETLKQGMREINKREPDVEAARAIGDRLLELSATPGTSTTWEYFFAFGGPSTPWTSAISQALATEFFHRLGTLVPDGEGVPYAQAAAGATNSFLRSVRSGGVSSKEGTGRFYVMYPFHSSQRILNGHLQSLLNVNRYAVASGNQRAHLVVKSGLRGVLPLLERFDTGAWSNYQPGQEAELGYHEFQTEQLTKLGDELGEPTLQEYGARFARYLETPPKMTVIGSGWPAIIPARDGFRDTAKIRYRLDKRARVTMVVRDEFAREVRRVSSYDGRGTGTISWDGTDNSGRTALDGSYLVTFTLTDVAKNRGYQQLETPLRVARDTQPPVLRMVTTRARGRSTMLTVNASDAGSAYVGIELRIGGKVVASMRGKRAGNNVLKVRRTLAQVKRGTLVLRDASGNELKQPLAD